MKNLIIPFLLLLATSCQKSGTVQMSDLDSLAIRVAVIEIHQAQQIDSLQKATEDLKLWVYDLEKEHRTSEYYLRKDFDQIKKTADSMAVRDPKNGKVWFAIGKVAGGIIKGVIPGL